MREGEGLLRLDDDVALVLHDIAERRFGGDVQMALNEELRAILLAELKPDDPWAAIGYQAVSREQFRRGSAQ